MAKQLTLASKQLDMHREERASETDRSLQSSEMVPGAKNYLALDLPFAIHHFLTAIYQRAVPQSSG